MVSMEHRILAKQNERLSLNWVNWAGTVAVPLLFFVMTAVVMPIFEVLEFDSDEGIELAKATLWGQGYPLYDPIWNDQPPLLTVLLAFCLQGFGHHIVVARLFILSFATLLVSSFYGCLRLVVGLRAALCGTLALCLTFGFLRFSVAVMQGIPALGLAMFAVFLLLWSMPAAHLGPQTDRLEASHLHHPHWRIGACIASGLCLGLSLQIKLYTALILPACLCHFVWGNFPWRGRQPQRWWPLLLYWLFACILAFSLVGMLTQPLSWAQLWAIHFNTLTQAELQREPSWLILLLFLVQDFDYTLLAGLGLWQWYKHQPQWPAIPVVWLGTVLLGLSHYQPLWDHYYPLLAVPIVWLATYGLIPALSVFRIPDWYRQLRQPGFWRTFPGKATSKTVGLVLLALCLVPVKLTILGILNQGLVQAAQNHRVVLDQVRILQPQTRWLFTDVPIAAFYANLNVPPEIAVFSNKRLKSGDLTTTKLTQILQTYRPEQVLLGRYSDVKTALAPYLDAQYCKRYQKDDLVQYVLPALSETPPCNRLNQDD
jgi:hypothetical protein